MYDHTAKAIIKANYSHNNEKTNENLFKIMTGLDEDFKKIIILPVDQGFEHGPDRSFAKNPDAYDPDYHINLAVAAKMNAYAAPLGMLEAVYGNHNYHKIPKILKINSSSVLFPSSKHPTQAITSSVKDAVRLGCSAVGLTIYPGSGEMLSMIEQAREIIAQARENGLASVVWSYARGEGVDKEHETSLDIINYSAHIACLIGADIIKVKPPINKIASNEAKKAIDELGIDTSILSNRIKMVKKACFNGKRILIFSGGAAKSNEEVIAEITQIHQGCGDGSIIGRNAFQRPFNEAVKLINDVKGIFNS